MPFHYVGAIGVQRRLDSGVSSFRLRLIGGKPYPDTVAFSYRELGRMVGRDIFGGQDSRQLYSATRQLEDINVELYLYDETGKEFRSSPFLIGYSHDFV